MAATICATVMGAATLGASPALASEPRSTLVVVLEDSQSNPRAVGEEMARRHGGSVGFVYRDALKGFSLSVPDRTADSIARDPRVVSVEYDQVFRTTDHVVPTGVARTGATGNANLAINGVDDQRVDVDIAIIDTGIDAAHPDLDVVAATNCSGGSPLSGSCVNGSAADGNGHGTHVAGSAAARDNGIGVVGMAPGARLHAVKVLNDSGSGYTSWIIAGIDWVTARAGTIEVANMSLGCECTSSAQATAIANSVAAGVTYAVAAGNSDKNASTFSPANHPDVITVSALADFNGLPGGGAASTCRVDQDDTLADFSNWGSTVEIAAPGVCILSTWTGGGYNTISGTSMASPHVAGAAALLASTRSTESRADTVAIKNALVSAGNFNWIDDSGDGVKEPLLDVSSTTVFVPRMVSQSPPANTPPTASFTSSCPDLACTFTSTSTDSDGTIASHAWAFGDNGTGTGASVNHTYAAGGTYSVTLTVTDNGGATGTTTQSVTVTSPPSGGISLSARGYKVKGLQKVDLTWTGGTTTSIDVIRDSRFLTNTTNNGAFTDAINVKGSGTYTYKVCETGSATACSNSVTVVF